MMARACWAAAGSRVPPRRRWRPEAAEQGGKGMDLSGLTETVRRAATQNPALGYRVKFVFEDGSAILWDGRSTPPAISNEDGAADTTIRVSAADLEAMFAGTLDATMAYMSGRLK